MACGLFVHVASHNFPITYTETPEGLFKMADSIRPSGCYKYADEGQRDDTPFSDASQLNPLWPEPVK